MSALGWETLTCQSRIVDFLSFPTGAPEDGSLFQLARRALIVAAPSRPSAGDRTSAHDSGEGCCARP
jgi:hypothetical protein